MRYALLLMLSGCATIHYGREQPLIPEEKSTYDCPAIALEIAKCDAFMRNVWSEWYESGGRRFLGIVGDFGIGNHLERGNAIESAQGRRDALVELGRTKNCPPPPPEPREY